MTRPSVTRGVRLAILTMMLLGVCAYAQEHVVVRGQLSTAFVSAGQAATQHTINEGRPTFLWRGDLFLDAAIAGGIILRSNARMTQDQTLHIDLLSVTMQDVIDGYLDIEAGIVDLPFLNLGNRRYTWNNPFLTLPLMNEYHLSHLPGGDHPYPRRTWDAKGSEGSHILDNGLYDIGMKFQGGSGIFDYGIAVINGSVGQTGTYSSDGLNIDKTFGLVGRIGCTPGMGLSIGISGAAGDNFSGEYLYDTSYGASAYNPVRYRQTSMGLDVEFSAGHFTCYGQSAYTEFTGPLSDPFSSVALSLEAGYVPLPRLHVAVRGGGIFFLRRHGTALVSGDEVFGERWDFDVVRGEGSIGYRISEASVLRFLYRRTVTLQIAGDPDDDLAAVQLVFSL
jgi:hypothetical protein